MASDETRLNAYARIVEDIFLSNYRRGDTSVAFERNEIASTARRLGINTPRNLGDVLYSFRYRRQLPDAITSTAPPDKEWAIFPAGRSVYEFKQLRFSAIALNSQLIRVKIPDATPGAISMYALSDEQVLLAVLRYNRLVDIFTRLTCYSLQNHLRTSIPVWNPIKQQNENTQVETDEIYVGIDRYGTHYAIPIEAKGESDSLNVIQIWQNAKVCVAKFPDVSIRCIAAKAISHHGIALIEVQAHDLENIAILKETHYQLVHPDQMRAEDIRRYRQACAD